ncbi:hypothetical protein BpHYR1_029224 [Brachionus plicatilis]|uniref:C2H2-type domain-containing protein n=1 Tax=Brachionus plicatilis TaxID=10195 RepID=A0A3M7S3Z0_BRAPC|nr:hypothetical protein BpHYR1_029224 [Brachionus plicatilis]
MSPSCGLVPHNGPISNKSSSSVSSAGSCGSAKSGKKSRQTIAALAAAAAVVRPGADSQLGLKDSSNIDQIINEVTEKSKASTASPKPAASKHLKKHHLLSASLPHSPSAPVPPKKEKTKKCKANEAPNLTLNPAGNQVMQSNQQAAAAAAAAALQYHHFLNNNLKMNSATPQKPNPKFHLANGGYVEEAENHMKMCKYEDADEEEPYDDEDIKDGHHAHLNGPLSIKSLTGPLTQSNTNSQSQGPNGTANMEFECAACEKKFKYYCYYKRHMDACHSDMPKYVCDTCNKSYKWEASFRQHLRSHHTAGQSGGPHEENGDAKYDGEENNENHEAHDMKENEEDGEEPDVGTNEDERIHSNERLYYERDHEHIGAAGTLASIAESLNGMHGRLMINNQMS